MVHSTTTVRNPLFTEASTDSPSSSPLASKGYPLLATGETNILIGGGGTDGSTVTNDEMYALLTTLRIIKPSMKLPYRLRLGSLIPSFFSIMCAAVTASMPSWGTAFTTFFQQKLGLEFYPFQLCSFGTYGDDDDPPLGCTTISPHLVFKSDPKYTLYGTGIVACTIIPLTLLGIVSLFCFPRIFMTPWPTILTALPVIGHTICVAISFQFRYTFLASNNPNASVPNFGVYSACVGIFCSLLSLVLVTFGEHQCYCTCCSRICCRCCGCPVAKTDDDEGHKDKKIRDGKDNYVDEDNNDDDNDGTTTRTLTKKSSSNRRKLSYTEHSNNRHDSFSGVSMNGSMIALSSTTIGINSSINSTSTNGNEKSNRTRNERTTAMMKTMTDTNNNNSRTNMINVPDYA